MKSWKRAPVVALALAQAVALSSANLGATTGGPARIAVRPTAGHAEFFNTRTGAVWVPRGFNYTVLDSTPDSPPGTFQHVELTTGLFNSAGVEAALEGIHSAGFDVVRIFIDGGDAWHQARGEFGIGGPADSRGIYQPYVDDLIEFLRFAAAHDVYVVPVFTLFPHNRYFSGLVASGADVSEFGYPNNLYLSPAAIDAKVRYVRDVVRAVKQYQGGRLLPAIFSWEIQNEMYFSSDAAPFNRDSGSVATADGRSYDMGDPDARQRCMDSNASNWAKRVAAAVRAEDPDALVSASFFTYGAVNKRGPNGLMPVPGADGRYPARPSVLQHANALSYFDVHVYPRGSSYSLQEDLGTLEFPRWDLRAYPALIGELGISTRRYPEVGSAVRALTSAQREASALGIDGWLYWTWNTPSRPGFDRWNALEADGALLNALQRP